MNRTMALSQAWRSRLLAGGVVLSIVIGLGYIQRGGFVTACLLSETLRECWESEPRPTIAGAVEANEPDPTRDQVDPVELVASTEELPLPTLEVVKEQGIKGEESVSVAEPVEPSHAGESDKNVAQPSMEIPSITPPGADESTREAASDANSIAVADVELNHVDDFEQKGLDLPTIELIIGDEPEKLWWLVQQNYANVFAAARLGNGDMAYIALHLDSSGHWRPTVLDDGELMAVTSTRYLPLERTRFSTRLRLSVEREMDARLAGESMDLPVKFRLHWSPQMEQTLINWQQSELKKNPQADGSLVWVEESADGYVLRQRM